MGALDHVNLFYVDNIDKAMEFKRWAGERRKYLGVDTETSGFSPERDKVRLIQFGDLNTGWAIPWEMWGGVGMEVLNAYTDPIVLHNSKFDSSMITVDQNRRKAGSFRWPWHLTNDTMAMAHILNPLRSKGLKPLGGMYIDQQAVSAQRMLDDAMTANKWTWATVPVDFPYYWIYGAMDPVLTCHLIELFEPEVKASYSGVYELEMGVTRVIADMERRGARVDVAYSETKMRELTTWSLQMEDWIMSTYRSEGLSGTTDLRLLAFFEAHGVEMLKKRTKAGRQSLDKEVLSTVQHPLAGHILDLRKAQKLAGTYFKNIIAFADENDRLHPNIWTMGTRTARMSVSEPALQTLPRKDPTVRTAFVPSDGNVMITADYDQVEARLMAHFSEDPGLIAAFGGDIDFFCAVASEIFQRTITQSTKEDKESRQLTKNSFYGKLYGAGVEKMALTAKVPFAVMEAVNAGLDTRFPGIRMMQRKINTLAQQRAATEGEPYINTPTGRKMIADDSKEYTLTNYLIQCHAAEILKRKILELDAVGLGEYMILPVHDELVFDIPADIAQDAMVQIPEIMADHTNYKVPITASADLLTTDWGEKYR